MSGRTPVTVETLDRFAALDAPKRLSNTWLANHFDVSTRTIARWRHMVGTAVPPRPPHPEEDRRLAHRLIFEEGCSIAEAARTVGTVPRLIKEWFPDAPRLTPQEAGHLSVLHREAARVLDRLVA